MMMKFLQNNLILACQSVLKITLRLHKMKLTLMKVLNKSKMNNQIWVKQLQMDEVKTRFRFKSYKARLQIREMTKDIIQLILNAIIKSIRYQSYQSLERDFEMIVMMKARILRISIRMLKKLMFQCWTMKKNLTHYSMMMMMFNVCVLICLRSTIHLMPERVINKIKEGRVALSTLVSFT